MMTHQNVVAAATSITTYLENRPNDIILNVLPISFDYGLYQVLMAMKVGATLILEKSFAFPQAILNKIATEQVYRPRFMRHRIGSYAASAAGESWFCRTAAGVW